MSNIQKDIRRLLEEACALGLSKSARERLQWFLHAIEHGGNIRKTCRAFAITPATFNRWAKRFDPGDPASLEDRPKRPRKTRTPETPPEVIEFIRQYRTQDPKMSRERIRDKLHREHGVTVSASSIGRVIRRNNFFFADTPSHWLKRAGSETVKRSEQEITDALVAAEIRLTQEALAQWMADVDSAKKEKRGTAGGGGGSAASAFVLIFCTAVLLGVTEVGGIAHAAEGANYRMYGDVANYAEKSAKVGVNYKLEESGVTDLTLPVTGASYQIVTGLPFGTGGGGGGGGEGGGGSTPSGGGGRRRPSASPPPRVFLTAPRPSALPPSAPFLRSAAPTAPLSATLPKGGLIGRPQWRNTASKRSAVKAKPAQSRGAMGVRYLDSWHRPQQSLERKKFQDAWHRPGVGSLFNTPAAYAYGGSPAPEDPYSSLLLQRNILFAILLLLLTILLTLTPVREHAHRRIRRFARRLERNPSRTKGKCSDDRPFRNSTLSLLLLFTVTTLMLGGSDTAFAATTVPRKHVYHGHLLTSNGTAVTTAHVIRFSYWKSADYVSADTTGTGAVNTGSSTYASWQEVHTVTPNSQGYFAVSLGSVTALPDMSAMETSTLTDLFLQVEVKVSGASDTTYDLLDENTSSSTIDRSPVLAVPFAFNADLLDKHDTGTASGSIAVLGSGGLLPVSTIPAGTNRGTFALDADGSESGSIGLQFGSSLANMLSFDVANDRFNFNDDVRIQGNLTVTGSLTVSGLINGQDLRTMTGALRVSSGGGLTVKVNPGNYRLAGNNRSFSGQNLTLTNNATTFIFFGSGGITARTSTYPGDESYIPLAEVVTQAGGVQAVTDKRVLTSDDRERSVRQIFHAEHQNASYQGDATNNVGRLYVSHDSTALRNYYLWTSTATTLQDYDISLRVTLSGEFARWNTGSGNHLRLTYRSTSANTANNKMDVSVYDTNGSPVTLSGSSTNLASTSWTTTQIEFTGSPTWTPGQDFLVKLKMYAKDNFQMHTGDLTLDFVELPTQ